MGREGGLLNTKLCGSLKGNCVKFGFAVLDDVCCKISAICCMKSFGLWGRKGFVLRSRKGFGVGRALGAPPLLRRGDVGARGWVWGGVWGGALSHNNYKVNPVVVSYSIVVSYSQYSGVL